MISQEKIDKESYTNSLLVPAYKPGYSLIYGTPHVYVLLKLLSTIYERLLMAKNLILSETISL